MKNSSVLLSIALILSFSAQAAAPQAFDPFAGIVRLALEASFGAHHQNP